jgi:type VI secretion system FHA domain protein
MGQADSDREPSGINPAVSSWSAPDAAESPPNILDGSQQRAKMPGFSAWEENTPRIPPRRRPATEPDHTPVEQEHFDTPSMYTEEGSANWDRTDFTSPTDQNTGSFPSRHGVDTGSSAVHPITNKAEWDRTDFTAPSDHARNNPQTNDLSSLRSNANQPPSKSPEWDRTDFISPSAYQKHSPADAGSEKIGGDDLLPIPVNTLNSEPDTRGTSGLGQASNPIPPSSAPDATGAASASIHETATTRSNQGDALQVFLQAAGLNETQIPPEAALALMKLLGGLYREIVQGLMDVLRARSDLKNEFRMRHTQISTKENNPLKFSGRLDEALEHLVFHRSSGYLSPEVAFQEAFQDIKDHQIAMVVGMRAAFESLLRRFDPELLESRIIKGKKIGHLVPLNRKANCWDRYKEWYAEISTAAEDDFQKLFGDEFTRAYENQVARLSLLRKKPGK